MLFGKTLVITGIASGIGARTAQLALAQGADVIGVDINAPANPGYDFVQADISSQEGIDRLLKSLPSRFDALCNIAGLSGNLGLASVLNVNFFGLRALSYGVAPKLRSGGAIVSVASIAGYGWRANLDRSKAIGGLPGFPDIERLAAEHGIDAGYGYPLSKELLLLWTQRAAHEVIFRERNIRINAVSPGPVETPILKQFRAVRHARRQRHRSRGPCRHTVRHCPGHPVPGLGWCALDQWRQCGSGRGPGSLDQCRSAEFLSRIRRRQWISDF